MELWDGWDAFLKVIASDHELTVDQEAVFLVRLSRQSSEKKRTNQDIANEVIRGEPDKAIYAYNKRMKEVFDKLSQSFSEINSESRGKVERTQACLEKAYLEQQKKKKSEAASHAIAPTDWHEICRKMLEDQKQNLRRQVTQMGFELNVFVPLGLVDRKHQPRRDGDFSLSPEQGSGFFQLDKEEIIKTYKHDEFLEQIIKQRQSKKSQGKRIAIIGEPGAGKTTLLEAIAFSPKTPGFPIWISLGSLGDKSLEEYLCQKWLKDALRTSDVTQQQKQLEELFKSGEVLLLLDGVDEMPAPSPVEALAKIREEFTGWVADARVVLTCRVNVWDANVNALQGFDTYRTLEFSYGDGNKPDQVREFICQWFSKAEKPELGERLREKLGKDRHQRIRDLVKNPLRLSLLCQSWYFRQGYLPKTQAALYEQFTQAFYDWKEEQFPITPTKRKELNAALGLLAREAIDQEKSRFAIRESFAIDVMGEDWFKLACKLHWLVHIYNDAETDEKVYAFFHPTFQEYFAAYVIPDWHYFLNHNNENPNPFQQHNGKDCVYRIFEPQWKEVILLWLGLQEVAKELKEEFIKALVKFQDECNDFYTYQAYFIAAVSIAEYMDFSLTDEVVAQIIKWGFGYFNIENQSWLSFLAPIAQAARARLLEMERKKVIPLLIDLLKTVNDVDILYLILSSLGKIGGGNLQAIDDLSRILETTADESIRYNVAATLGRINPGNQRAITELVKGLDTSENQTTRQIIAMTLRQIDPHNEWVIAEPIKVSETTANKNYSCGYSVRSIWQKYADNPQVIAKLRELETIEDETTRCSFAVGLGIIEPSNPRAITELVKVLETTENTPTRLFAAYCLTELGTDNPQAVTALFKMIARAKDWFERSLLVGDLNEIIEGKYLQCMVMSLRNSITTEVYRNEFNRYEYCYEIIWHCAQKLPYPDFYNSWNVQFSKVHPLKNISDISS